jgi:hypothetical protein
VDKTKNEPKKPYSIKTAIDYPGWGAERAPGDGIPGVFRLNLWVKFSLKGGVCTLRKQSNTGGKAWRSSPRGNLPVVFCHKNKKHYIDNSHTFCLIVYL